MLEWYWKGQTIGDAVVKFFFMTAKKSVKFKMKSVILSVNDSVDLRFKQSLLIGRDVNLLNGLCKGLESL